MVGDIYKVDGGRTVTSAGKMRRAARRIEEAECVALWRRGLLVPFCVVVSVAMNAHLASAQTIVQTSDQAAAQDLADFASYFHVSIDEARKRAELQVLAGSLDAELAAKHPSEYGGLWIDNAPAYQVTIAFTQKPQGVDQLINPLLAPWVTFRTVAASQESLIQELNAIASQRIDASVYAEVDVRRNSVDVRGLDVNALQTELVARLGELPDYVTFSQTQALSVPVANLYGGKLIGNLGWCTSGFGIIRAGTGQRGIVTAGHCADKLYYEQHLLTWQDESVGGPHDEQWMTLSGYTVKNWIQVSDDGIYRLITSRTFKVNQPTGATVCKYGWGTDTHYLCGEIATKYATGCVQNAAATYVRVHRNAVDLSEEGDSGGPWFWINSAWGMMVCKILVINQTYHDGIYESEDSVEAGLNITVMTAP
jgi:hypothetical protein